MAALHLHITGIVQGVGFRPHVYVLAHKFSLKGYVMNTSDGVHIDIQGTEDELQGFCRMLRENPPELARITGWHITRADQTDYLDFSIRESMERNANSVLLTPDYGLCEDCEKEMLDSDNRRFRYPFITCTKCGPRYSIIDSLPYDRERTAMKDFIMCPECSSEYDQISDRRYYSQTNSCGACGIELAYFSNDRYQQGNSQVLACISYDLNAGRILAVKGIGGYLLMCDATNAEAVRLLRKRKSRPSKPFALLYRDEEMLSADVHTNEMQLEAFRSVEAPIVLFRRRQNPASGIALEEVAPGMDSIGIMRPYAPLLSLISGDFARPLIATSGNLSGAPIIYDDEEALKSLSWIADAVVTHNRRINIPQDDSVLKYTSSSGKRIILRRSRGMAPNYFGPALGGRRLLAMGGSLKSSFSLQHGQNTYISQYLGDQDSFDTQKSYRHTLEHLCSVLDFKPEMIVADMHPSYASTLLGKKMAEQAGLPFETVQHHEAHFAAVLAENKLLNSVNPVLGVIWDGTGYGTDKNVWGGEFLSCHRKQISRIRHFDYYDHILSDKMPREPRISALSILFNTVEETTLKKYFNNQEWDYYHKILRKGSDTKTSSIGRLFDAAAFMLGLSTQNSFEGESAMKLECLARHAKDMSPWPVDEELAFSPAYHLLRMIHARRKGHSAEDSAWQFHAGLVSAIDITARDFGYREIAFSGGVFQNEILVDLIEELLGKKYKLYFHKELSPNDENISFGQLVHASCLKSMKMKFQMESVQELNT